MRTITGRRTEIMEVAAAMFAERGIGATTVREIGESAGVLSGSLYHHFSSKDEIVREVLADFMDQIERAFSAVAAASTSPEETVRGLVRATLECIDSHPHATRIYQRDRAYLRKHGLLDAIDTKSRAVRRHWRTAIDAGIASGDFRAEVPGDVFYRSLRDTLWATMHWPNRASWSTEEFADLMASMFLGGFRAGS
ncbi:TetR/AcrR family transcriptional regulator [Nocardioides sp. SLBN-35]|jgi:AcrR family transcriptional regulator|uniref:TetR/AcrR family transcriptional regulator n=1 Tax=Nocardioides sp. SLBN-35 TaxID=2768445 RepID=UPI00114E7E90|nr:TetR/AcrR family transcriptional regulator [Nocardioides sp. SLBN-35]TQK71985.1 TetR family transcriptional regulator [Nocardioides sp. SLBN-35]